MFGQSIIFLLLTLLNISLAQNYPPGVPVPRTQGKQSHCKPRCVCSHAKIEQYFSNYSY